MKYLCVITGFHREVGEICALLGYYKAHSGNYLPTFRGQHIGLNSKDQEISGGEGKMFSSNGLSQKSVRNYHYTQHNIPEKHRSHNTGNYSLRTRMNTNTEAQLFSLLVFDLKTFYFFEKMESHGCNFSSVSVTVTHWQTTHNHVSISNRLNFIHIIV